MPPPGRRAPAGRLVVLDDSDKDTQGEHPFTTAYAEALSLPVGTHTHDNYHSAVLQAWGVDLYDAVADDLRPVVLQLVVAAACARVKRDTWWRLADWLGRVELAAWYTSTGFPQVAALLHDRGQITDKDSYLDWWPAGVASHRFWQEFDNATAAATKAAGLAAPDDHGAAAWLAENGLADNAPIARRRDSLRNKLDHLAGTTTPTGDVPILPDRGDLWGLRAMYAEPMWALARPYTRRTAEEICAIVGWDPESPAPPDGHPLREIGYSACVHTSQVALAPYVHDAHIREIDAFRRTALGKPW
jgi:hypothetical protein